MSKESEELELFHYGVKGMRWGVRNSPIEGVSRSTARTAKKDAKEHTQAKVFYGTGAGTRRKLIKARVEQRSKNPGYKKAFDYYSKDQNLDKAVSKAKRDRLRKDATATAGKTARGIKNLTLKTAAPVTVTSVLLYSAYQNPKVQKAVKDKANVAYSTVKNSPVTDMVKKKFF